MYHSGILNEVLSKFLSQIDNGLGIMSREALFLLRTMTAIELGLVALWWAYSGGEALGKLFRKCLTIMFFVWVVTEYSEILTWVVGGFKWAGAAAAGRWAGMGPPPPGQAANYADNPSLIVAEALTVIEPILDAARNSDWWDWVQGLFLIICALLIFLCYGVLAIQVLLTHVEFGLVASLGVILIPFGVFKHTAFLAERVFGAIVSFGVKLMVLTFVVNLGFPLIASYQLPANPPWPPMLCIILSCLCLCVLALHAPGVAASLLTGGPSLSASAGASAAVAGGMVVGGGLRAGTGTASATLLGAAHGLGAIGKLGVGALSGGLGAAAGLAGSAAAAAKGAGAGVISKTAAGGAWSGLSQGVGQGYQQAKGKVVETAKSAVGGAGGTKAKQSFDAGRKAFGPRADGGGPKEKPSATKAAAEQAAPNEDPKPGSHANNSPPPGDGPEHDNQDAAGTGSGGSKKTSKQSTHRRSSRTQEEGPGSEPPPDDQAKTGSSAGSGPETKTGSTGSGLDSKEQFETAGSQAAASRTNGNGNGHAGNGYSGKLKGSSSEKLRRLRDIAPPEAQPMGATQVPIKFDEE